MSAKDAFWFAYADMLYKGYYLSLYRERITDRDKHIGWFIAIASSLSVATWAVWNRFPWLWACIVAVAQIVELARPSLHFSEQFYALSLMGTEVQSIVNEMERFWLSINDSIDDSRILKKLKDCKEQYNSLDSKYLSSWNLKPNKKCQEEAMDYRDNYISSHYLSETVKKEVTV